ncbi:RES domain-containing protein [Oligoflexus sp.]|uniref:RES domain-containing protein n=1 Tax=Oligoflexus sp. TaxID=1971216 RepID=UPI002D78F0C4|nr:RES domain-containing protein [Oligoflexus sp.]
MSLFRLGSPDWYRSLFNPKGPKGRFDHHPAGEAQEHEGYGICYLGGSLRSCIAETCLTSYPTDYSVNGVLKSDRIFVEVEVLRDLELLDLTEDGPLLAGTFQGILDEYQRRSITQAWARRFYHNPYSEYKRIDGIQWLSSKNGETVYAVYERAREWLRIKSTSKLTRRPLKLEVLRICDEYRLIFD